MRWRERGIEEGFSKESCGHFIDFARLMAGRVLNVNLRINPNKVRDDEIRQAGSEPSEELA